MSLSGNTFLAAWQAHPIGSLSGDTFLAVWRAQSIGSLSQDTFMAAWPAQLMASVRVCAACKAALGYRSGDPSTVHAAAIDSGIIRFLPREHMAHWCF